MFKEHFKYISLYEIYYDDWKIIHKNEIENLLGDKLNWNRGDDIKSSKIYYQINDVSIENEMDWPQMAKFHADWSKKFYDVIVPYLTLD